ncbi:MAG: hypothetical protein ABJM29_15675 [Rhizobiaceae bacterium]
MASNLSSISSRIVLATATLLTFMPASALASGGVWCTGEIDGEKFNLNISTGRSHILSVLNAQVSIGEKEWATQPANGEQEIVFGQGMIEGTKFAADFADPSYEVIMFGLRVDFAGMESRTDDTPFEGTVSINEKRAIPVFCHGDG